MATASRKRTRRQTALDLDDLRARLTDVDESNPEDLLAFKRALQAVVSDLPCVSAPRPLSSQHRTALTHAQDATPTIAASKLTRAQVFTFFGLQNAIVTKWGRSGYDIPAFELMPEFLAPAANPGPSEWLTQALDLWGTVFGRNNEADVRTYINLLIMDVIRDVQLFQADGQLDFAPRAKLPADTADPPARCGSVIRAYNEVQVATTLHVDGKDVRILGRFDIGFSHGTASPKQSGGAAAIAGGMFTDSYLAVLETKGVRYDTEAAFNQLLVYLAMVQRARAQKLKRTGLTNGNCVVYGVLSDGDKFLFVCLDNNAIVPPPPLLLHAPLTSRSRCTARVNSRS